MTPSSFLQVRQNRYEVSARIFCQWIVVVTLQQWLFLLFLEPGSLVLQLPNNCQFIRVLTALQCLRCSHSLCLNCRSLNNSNFFTKTVLPCCLSFFYFERKNGETFPRRMRIFSWFLSLWFFQLCEHLGITPCLALLSQPRNEFHSKTLLVQQDFPSQYNKTFIMSAYSPTLKSQ